MDSNPIILYASKLSMKINGENLGICCDDKLLGTPYKYYCAELTIPRPPKEIMAMIEESIKITHGDDEVHKIQRWLDSAKELDKNKIDELPETDGVYSFSARYINNDAYYMLGKRYYYNIDEHISGIGTLGYGEDYGRRLTLGNGDWYELEKLHECKFTLLE